MRLFVDDDFQLALEIALGGTYSRAADIGETLATAERIPDGDPEAWISQWSATAVNAWGAAETARHAGRRVSGLAFYRRAATYYAAALRCASRSIDFDAERELALWRRQRQCWEYVVDLSPSPGERLTIPYERTSLHGYFFPAPGSARRARRPLVIVNNGTELPTSSMWAHGGAAAAERGYHWMTFDGPGQQYALYEQGLSFRPDWEAVLTPVIDALLTRPDLDPARMAVIGIGRGGSWVLRALAFEHRLTAAVVDGGAIEITGLDPGGVSRTMGERPETGRATETVGQSFLGDEVKEITTPLLITDPEGQDILPGQPRAVYERLTGERKLARFTTAEGADRHGQPLAMGLREARIFDWLDGHLG